MLVLSRKSQQDIMIGENVRITILQIKGNTVRLGIEAPRDVRVIRGELPVHETVVDGNYEFTLEFGGESTEDGSKEFAAKDTLSSKYDIPTKTKRIESNRSSQVKESRASFETPNLKVVSAETETDEDSGDKMKVHNRVLEILSTLTRNPR